MRLLLAALPLHLWDKKKYPDLAVPCIWNRAWIVTWYIDLPQDWKIRVCVYLYIYICICLYMVFYSTHICVYINTYIYIFIHMHTYIYIYTYIHIYIHIYIYLHICSPGTDMTLVLIGVGSLDLVLEVKQPPNEVTGSRYIMHVSVFTCIIYIYIHIFLHK